MKQKLTSRKLWAMIVGVITGLAMVFGLDESVISTVAGAVTTAGSIVAYIIAEGGIDKARAKSDSNTSYLDAVKGLFSNIKKD